MNAHPEISVATKAFGDLLQGAPPVTNLMWNAAPSNFTLKLANRRRRAQG